MRIWSTFVWLYHKLLISEVKESPFFTLCFDESLNPVLQNCQMNCGVWYWDEKRGISKVRYLDSKLLNRPNSKNLYEKLLEVLSEPKIGLEKMIQLSMDGPYVNWEVLKFLIEKRAEMGFPDLLDIGSCGLHISWGFPDKHGKPKRMGVEKNTKGHFFTHFMIPQHDMTCIWKQLVLMCLRWDFVRQDG